VAAPRRPRLYRADDWARRADVAIAIELPVEKYRSAARRDSARLTHSPAFRRLQGKTQLFPGVESDYFRNRLTHSLEVGQIAKSIAIRLNDEKLGDKTADSLDVDLVEFAGWCHDLGHPPFGHQGEEALDIKMRELGGFEGNAQTLRIISRLEKRQHSAEDGSGIDEGGIDRRLGLNLSARSLAAILKYDAEIPLQSSDRKDREHVAKGYYHTDRDTVRWIKRTVAPGYRGRLKTIECQIMDLADDIAYSTYDLEDTFKAGFLGPLDLLAANKLYGSVAAKVSRATKAEASAEDVAQVLLELFGELADGVESELDFSRKNAQLASATTVYQAAATLARDGYLRSFFTSRLIRLAIEGVQLDFDEKRPVVSKVRLTGEAERRVEVLKHFTYEATIQSNRVTVSQFRAKEILHAIFDALSEDQRLLPDDARTLYARVGNGEKARVICDFIAGMTDRYAVEFYGRIRSENPQTIFKPL